MPRRNFLNSRSDRGATMVETAIFFLVFMILSIGLIDWGTIYTKRMLIRQAFSRATRAGALPAAGCLDAAQRQFENEMIRYNGFLPAPVRADMTGMAIDIHTAGATTLRGLVLTTPIELKCITCGLYSGNPIVNYTLQSRYPFQVQNGDCANGSI